MTPQLPTLSPTTQLLLQRPLQPVVDEPEREQPDQGADVIPLARPLPNLHAEFWEKRPSLRHVRDAAHAACASPDLVLHAMLARLASMQHHEVRVDAGLGEAPLNYAAIIVGPSGAGKSTGVSIARDLLPTPERLYGDAYRDGIPLGSGEGLAETFMGTVEEETDELIKSGPKRGEYRTKPVRKQCRHNAFLYVDEGESLLRTLERSGSTIGPALRSAWAGETLGQANASQDSSRIVMRGTYALGMVIGFQPGTIAPLFGDSAGGTPQRFMFASATDLHIPDEPVEWPGALEAAGPASQRVIRVVDADVRRRVRAERLARQRGEDAHEDPLDAHRPLHVAKTSALLALLDGRHEITGEDWGLAQYIWSTSVRVRDELVRRDQAETRRRVAASHEEYASKEARAEAARQQVPATVARIARLMAAKVHDDGIAGRPGLRKALASRDRGYLDAALDHAMSQDWIVATEDGLEPGRARPA